MSFFLVNFSINPLFKLHRMDTSNSNAFKRVIVLHSYEYVPDSPPHPLPCPTSWGCPMVSNNLMKKLDVLLKREG